MTRLKRTAAAIAVCGLTIPAAIAEPLPCQGRYNVVTGDVITGTDDAALAQGMQNAAAQLAGDGVTFGPLSDGKSG